MHATPKSNTHNTDKRAASSDHSLSEPIEISDEWLLAGAAPSDTTPAPRQRSWGPAIAAGALLGLLLWGLI